MELSLLCFLYIAPLAWAAFPSAFYDISSLLPRSNPTSTDGNCGSNSESNATCLTSQWGNCCSSKGYCGSTSAYCSDGCQSAFGTCASADTQVISTSGSCGATSTSNVTCQGSTFGDCCSALGYCGGNSSYCGTGCQTGFGTCGSSTDSSSVSSSTYSKTSSTSAALATSIGGVSIDGNCGSNSDILATCQGSTFGNCCSPVGYCGGNSSYCGTGCQSKFGSCGSSASVNSTSTNSSSTASGSPSSTSTSAPLSTGAKAGIGIGATVFALSAFGVVAWFIIRRRRRGGVCKVQEMDTDESFQKKQDFIQSVPGVHEIGGRSDFGAVEMPLNQKRTELDAGYTQEKERQRSVDERAAAGYDGAYRGN